MELSSKGFSIECNATEKQKREKEDFFHRRTLRWQGRGETKKTTTETPKISNLVRINNEAGSHFATLVGYPGITRGASVAVPVVHNNDNEMNENCKLRTLCVARTYYRRRK